MKISRRDFVHASCAAAAVSLAPSAIDKAEALFKRGSAQTSGFNGGKSQLQGNVLSSDTSYPFLNELKTGTRWLNSGGPGGVPTPDTLDANNYPISFASGVTGITSVISIPSQASRPGNRVIVWSGASAINMNGTSSPVSASFTASITGTTMSVTAVASNALVKGQTVVGAASNTIIGNQLTGTAGSTGTYQVTVSQTLGSTSLTSSSGSLTASGSGRFLLIPTGTQAVGSPGFPPFITLSVLAAGFTQFNNAYVCHVDDEASLNAGNIFGVQFLSEMRALNPGVLRCGDWANMNTTTETTWATRKPESFFSYFAYDLRPSLYGGKTTTVTGNAYNLTTPAGYSWPGYTPGGAPVDKQILLLNFDHTGSTTSTLNLNGAGVLPILDYAGGTYFGGGSLVPVANNNACLVYDGVWGGWLLANNNSGINSGWPPETFMKLCILLGCHPHVVTPYLAAETLAGGCTDYMPSLTQMYKTGMPLWMIVHTEGVNEEWNGLFLGSQYATNRSLALWANVPEPFGIPHDYYGTVIMRNIGSAVSTVFSGDTTKYSILCGCQQVDGGASSSARVASQRRLSYRPCTFNSGTGNTVQITDVGNGFAANTPFQILTGSSTGSLQGPLVKNTTLYYVKTPGDTFTISATPGGAAIVYTNNNVFDQATNTVVCDQTIPATWITHGCFSTYQTASEFLQNIELIRAYNYYVGGDLTQADDYVDSLNTNAGSNQSNISANLVLYQNWKTFFQSFGINKMCGYEGGWSSRLTTTDSQSIITGASQATSCVLTLASTQGQANSSNTVTGNPAVVGMPLYLHGVVGMTQLNCVTSGISINNATGVITWSGSSFNAGQVIAFENGGSALPAGASYLVPYYVVSPSGSTFQVSATLGGSPITAFGSGTGTSNITAFTCWIVTAVSGNLVTIGIDSTGFTAWASGGTQLAQYIGSGYSLNQFRFDSRMSTHLQGYTYGGYLGSQSNYGNFVAQTGGGFVAEFPSQYTLAGDGGNLFYMFSDDIWATPSPAYAGIAAFNHS